MSETTAEKILCRLAVSIVDANEEGLKLHYQFTNRRAGNVYIFNRLYSRLNGRCFNTNINLTYIEIDKQQVIISKKVYPVPRNVRVESLIVPCATLVRPGATISESIELKLPTRPCNPYKNAHEFEDHATALNAAFEIGFVAPPPEGEKFIEKVQTLDGPAFYFGSFPAKDQELLRAGPLTSKISVKLPIHDTTQED